MKLLSSMVFAGAVALAVVPALAAGLNISGSLANTGFNTVGGSGRRGGNNTLFTGNAAAFSQVKVVGSSGNSAPTNVSVAIANSGVNNVSGGSNYVSTGNAMAGSSVTVVNMHSSFGGGL